MTARTYEAHYKCSACDKEITISIAACDYQMALVKLPRWCWPDGHKMRRLGGPTIKRDNNA
jgi:hypothetical protein